MNQRAYKYYREDFGALPVDLLHLTIFLNFFPDRVEATATFEMTAREDLSRIVLDARDLEIIAVEAVESPDQKQAVPLEHSYAPEAAKLTVNLAAPVGAGEEFMVRTHTLCHPNETVLEGIYKDTTPKGAPQQFISQCQQWGFQRIMPIIDDCRAKCTFTTTLEADAAYTHLISNGNIDPRTNPQGRPAPKPGEPDRQVITFHNPVPMAPYLFIAAAGTWDELVDEVTYLSGKTVRLEYLVPPGKVEDAHIPMEILKKSVLWVERTQDYEYPNDTYRTITMNRSNFGGMENVGNTTIVTDAALVDAEHTMDLGLLYAHAVIVHEFEHNQCGSETTMATPFDIWLNEAYTVDVERQFMASQFDPGFVRLQQVDSIRGPLMGPLVLEDGGRVGRIVREAFNDPDELIDGVTYVKAAEVIRMLRLVVGEDSFTTGKTLYFTRFGNSNAESDDFFACFEEASGISLDQFKKQWLYTIGYPKVTARGEYDSQKGSYTITLRQDTPEGVGPFHLPLAFALVGDDGEDLPGTAQVYQLKERQAQLHITGLSKEPAFASLNRGYSFYGTFHDQGLDAEGLIKQARFDPDPFNRVEAMGRFTDLQRIRLMKDADAAVDTAWLELYGEFLGERRISPSLASRMLGIGEQPLDRDYLAWYPEQVVSRDRLLAEVNRAHRAQLVERFNSVDTYRRSISPKEGIEERQLKATLLGLIASQDIPESHTIILEHWERSAVANDRVSALAALNRTSAPQRLQVLEDAYGAWHGHLSGYGNYLRCISAGTQPDVFDLIAKEAARESFEVSQPTWCRALYLPMAMNIRVLWTEVGVTWLTGQIINLAGINTTTASRMLNAFQLAARLREPLKAWAATALERIVREVSPGASPVIHGQAGGYLQGMKG